MITEDEAVILLRRANPVPTPNGYELGDRGPAAHGTLLEKTSEAQPAARIDEGMRRLIWWAAATAVLIVGFAIVLVRQDSRESFVATERTTSTTTEPASSTMEPTATTSVLSGIPIWLGSGDGQWVPAQASVPFAFTSAGNWNSSLVWNTPDRFTICVPEGDSPRNSRCINGSVSVLRLDQGDVEATKAFLASFDGAELSDEEPIIIGGADGIRFRFTHDISPTPGGQIQGDLGVPPAVDFGAEKIPIGVGPLGTGIVSIVDVAGETMTIVYQGEDASRGAVEDGFNTNMQQGLQIIDSILWGPIER